MGSFCRSLLLVLAIFFFVWSSCSSTKDTEYWIQKICNSTSDYSFCSDIFHKNLPNPNTNLVGLAQLAVAQGLLHATDTGKFVKQSKASEKNKEKRELYVICDADYEFIINEYAEAFRSFGSGDHDRVLDDITRSQRFENDCDKVFAGIQVPLLHQKNIQMLNLMRMAYMAIVFQKEE